MGILSRLFELAGGSSLDHSQPFLSSDQIETPGQDRGPALASPSHTPEPTTPDPNRANLKELTWSPESTVEQFSFNAGEEGFTCFTYSQLSQTDAENVENIIARLLVSSNGELEFINLPTVRLVPQSLVGLVYKDGVDNDLVGFWLANPNAIDTNQYEFLVVIYHKFRQKGIAKNLVEYACRFLISQGVSAIIADVEAQNIAVQKLIQKIEQTYQVRHQFISYGDETRYVIYLPTSLTLTTP